MLDLAIAHNAAGELVPLHPTTVDAIQKNAELAGMQLARDLKREHADFEWLRVVSTYSYASWGSLGFGHPSTCHGGLVY